MDEKTLGIRSHRTPGWWWASNELIDVYGPRVGANGIAVYAVLARHADNNSQQCWPGLRRIAGLLAIGRNQVIAAIKTLEAAGLVQIERHPGQGNLYTLCTPVAADGLEAPVETDYGDCESPVDDCESPPEVAPVSDQSRSGTTTSPAAGLPPVPLRDSNKTQGPILKKQHQPVGGVFSQSLRNELTNLGMSVAGAMVVEANWSESQAAKALDWVNKLPGVANRAGYLLSLAKTNRDPDGFVLPRPGETESDRKKKQAAINALSCWESNRQPCGRSYSWCSVCDLAGA
jgi:biotin operon repressor